MNTAVPVAACDDSSAQSGRVGADPNQGGRMNADVFEGGDRRLSRLHAAGQLSPVEFGPPARFDQQERPAKSGGPYPFGRPIRAVVRGQYRPHRSRPERLIPW